MFRRRALCLDFLQFRNDGRRDALGNLVLNREYVRQVTIQLLCPDVMARLRIDELGCNADLATGPAYTALEDIARAQRLGDVPRLDGLSFIGKRRLFGDDRERPPQGERGDDIFGKPVGEVFLLRVAGQVVEGEHGNRGFVGRRHKPSCPPRACGVGAMSCDAIDPDRVGDVLEGLFAQILELGLHLAPYLAVGFLGKADSAGFRQAFEARCHVDAVAMDIAALNDHVPEVDADTEQQSCVCVVGRVSLTDAVLPGEGAADGVHDTGELDQEPVAHKLDDASMMRVDQRFQKISAQLGQLPKRAGLVGAHQSRVTGHIGCQNSGESAFQTRPPSRGRLATGDRRIHAGGTAVQ